MESAVEKTLIYYLRNRYVLKEKVNAHTTYRCRQQGYIRSVTYSRPFDDKWTNREIAESIIKLNCQGTSYLQLSVLPDLPNCRKLHCGSNKLTSLPRLDECIELSCAYNNLTTLGSLPKCEHICCWGNKIREIGVFPSCKSLTYDFDSVVFIRPLPQIQRITTNYMARGSMLDYWRKQWAYRERKYFRLWYLVMMKMKAKKRIPLHEELRFSPDTLIENEYTLAKKSFESKQT